MGSRFQRRYALTFLNAIHWRGFYAHAIPILCYHAIPSRGSFEAQIACIQECGWTVVGLKDVIGWIARQKTPKLPALVLTFDDCYTNQFTNAVPVLTQFGYPATFFAVSQRIGQHLDWNGPKGGAGLSLMGRSELLELRRRGFDVGCHSRTHPKLSEIPSDLQKMEISGGKRDIENILGEEVWCFSYPHGDHTSALVDIVRECGFSAAVSVRVGAVHSQDDPFTLKRLCVPVEASTEELMAQFTWIPQLAEIVRRVPPLDVLARKLWNSG
jgi:peptidoglycan/xylan/chitin deacetylase (PgdA/CDA1 family)